jgi:hypothetical protein
MPIHSARPTMTTTLEITNDRTNTLAYLRDLRTPESNLRVPLVAQLPQVP